MHNSCLAGPSSCDEYPDRDILCSANDVTRKEYFSRCFSISEEDTHG